MNGRVCCIVNPAAAGGQGRERWVTIRNALRRAGFTVEERFTEAPGEGLQFARAAAASFPQLVAAGGDGTVAEVASGLIQSGASTSLALIPTGTGNDVATQLGIRSIDAAIALLGGGGGQLRRLDAIEARSLEGGREVVRHALLFAAVGFAGELLRQTTPRVKRWFGPRFCYSVGFLRALMSYRPPEVQVEADDQRFTGRWLHVCAGNSEWAGGGAMHLSPGARWDDGALDLCLIPAMSRLATAAHFPKLIRGTFVGHPAVRYFRGTRLAITADQPIPLQLDGDLVGTTPATFSLRPGAVSILAPGPA